MAFFLYLWKQIVSVVFPTYIATYTLPIDGQAIHCFPLFLVNQCFPEEKKVFRLGNIVCVYIHL